MSTRTPHVGLVPIGMGVTRQCPPRRGFRVVGAVDRDPQKLGLDVGTLIGRDSALRVRVTGNIAGAIRTSRPQVAVLCTSSSLAEIVPQIAEVLRHEVPIVSTTEELTYPVGRNGRLAASIDRRARRDKVAVLGTGVNPGFAMDALPIMRTRVCQAVMAIRVDRVQGVAARRPPFRPQIGTRLTVEQFRERVWAGAVRHVGLGQSPRATL